MKLIRLIKENATKAAITNNKAALTVAINKRLANDEDQSASDAVEALLIKTAIDAGLPKEYAENYPWMENYAVPEESTAAEDIKMLQGHLEDALNDPKLMSSSSNKKTGTSTDSKQDVSAFTKAATQGVYLLGETAENNAIYDRMSNRNEQAHIMGWVDCHPVVVKDGSSVYLLFLDSPEVMFPTKDPSGINAIVQVKNNKFVQDMYVAPPPFDKPDPLSQDKKAIELKDRLAAKIKQAGFGDMGVRDKLAKQTNINPALTGEIKIPECSEIQRELV